MTPTDKEKVSKIIVDMLMEFQKEQRRIQTEYDNGLSRLSEIEENLINYRETEDVDFKVFSPRKVSTLNEDKLNSMDSEMKEIEEDNKQLQKQLKYYSDKVEKLLVVQAIIDGEVYDISELFDAVDNRQHFECEVDEELRAQLALVDVKKMPICTKADGLNVMDDVGGISGLLDFYRIINGDDPDEKAEMREWARCLGWTGRMSKPEKMV